jgi:hypothetical protein
METTSRQSVDFHQKNLRLLDYFDNVQGVFKLYFQKTLESDSIQVIFLNHLFTTIGKFVSFVEK